MKYQRASSRAIFVDTHAHAAFVENQRVPLPPKTVELLELLVAHAGSVVSKDVIAAALWPHGDVEDRNLAQHIYTLRRVLEAHGVHSAVETVPRRGYRYSGPLALRPALPALRKRAGIRRIAILIGAAIGLSLAQQTPQVPALSGNAAREYTLGRYFLNLRTVAGIRLSRRYFNEVIRSRADSPLGYSGLADADVAVYDYVCKDAGCRGIVSQARRSAAAALKRDPQSPEAHTSYGMILWDMNRDYRGAEREFKSALAIDRHYALAHQWYGSLLLADGRSREALTELQAASNDNPIATATYAWAAMAAYFGDRFEDAVMLSNEALRFDPRRADSIVIRALAFRRLAGDRRAAEALQTLRGVRKVSQLTPVMQRFGDTCHVDDAGLSCDWRLIAR